MIKKIKWNHEVLGNLELDFTKPDGTLYNTIVLAGENGTGKTTILETLSTFLNLGSMDAFKSIGYIADGTQYTITPNPNHPKLLIHPTLIRDKIRPAIRFHRYQSHTVKFRR